MNNLRAKHVARVNFAYEIKDHDQHKCPVIMSASDYDFNILNIIDNQNSICTDLKEHSWFQIEFTEGRAVLLGFRLKKCDAGKLKSYKIICTDLLSICFSSSSTRSNN